MFEQSRGVKRGREQDNDPMLDRHGNSASPKLFVNKLPTNIKEEEIVDLFSKYDGFVNVQLGNKVLLPGEFRTCVVKFNTSEQAAAARVGLQHHQASEWTNPMLINFVKQDTRDSQYHSDNTDLEKDLLGNYACSTLFVKNFSSELTHDDVSALFPAATKIFLGNKMLSPGEYRTAYISFDDTPAAIAARKNKLGFKDDKQTEPLVIYYSVRPKDQTKPTYPPPKGPSTHHSHYPHAPGSPGRGMGGGPLGLAALGGLYGGLAAPLPLLTSAAFSPYPPIGSLSLSSLGSLGGPLNPYSTLPALYGGYPPPPASSGYPDPYGHPPYSPHLPSPPILEDNSYSLADLFDAKGNAAHNSLFVDCLPSDIRENQIHSIFARSVGFKGLHMGNKSLAPGEYRTAVVHFNNTKNALIARANLQNYREPSWSRPLLIHYAKH